MVMATLTNKLLPGPVWVKCWPELAAACELLELGGVDELLFGAA